VLEIQQQIAENSYARHTSLGAWLYLRKVQLGYYVDASADYYKSAYDDAIAILRNAENEAIKEFRKLKIGPYVHVCGYDDRWGEHCAACRWAEDVAEIEADMENLQ
jgi:monomeric isocitrate dehydrogenase